METLSGTIDYYKGDIHFYDDVDKVIKGLGEVLQASAFVGHIQSNGALVDCFVCGSYALIEGIIVEKDTVSSFYDMFAGMTEEKRQTMLANIGNRLYDKSTVYKDGLPF